MIDTIRLLLQLNKFPDVSEKVQLGKRYTSKNGNEVFLFLFNGAEFRIINNPNKLQMPFTILFEGSFTKLLLGNNLACPSLNDFKFLVKKLSKNFGVDFSKAFVTRLDIAMNIIVSEDLLKYILRCKKYRNHDKILYATKTPSIYFTSTTNEIILYDKIAELKNKKISIPDFFKMKRVLRIENRLMQRIKNLNGEKLILKDLLKTNTYNFYINKLFIIYFNIEKIYTKKLLPFKNKTTLMYALAHYAVSNCSEELFIEEHIQDNFNKGMYKMNTRSNLRTNVRELRSSNKQFDDENIFYNVDTAVNLLKNIYR